MEFDKVKRLEMVYEGLDALIQFVKPALPFINSHLTEFYTANHWDTLLPPLLREDLNSKSITEMKQELVNLMNENSCMDYYGNSPFSQNPLTFENVKSFEDAIAASAKFQLSTMHLSTPVTKLCFNGVELYKDSNPSESRLKLDAIMSAKKMHEVEVMSDLVKKISETVLHSEHKVEYLVDMGSGKGYLSSYLTLLHQFKILAVDSSSVNTTGCEKRSARMEKVWAQLLRRAVERQFYGKPSRRGKHWKSKSTEPSPTLPCQSSNNEIHSVYGVGESSERLSKENKGDNLENSTGLTTTSPLKTSSSNDDGLSNDNKLLKTLTQFVTPDFDLTTSMMEHFSSFKATHGDHGTFGIVGLHTCGNLGFDSLRLFISNENARFICNVPCCYNLLQENHPFGPGTDTKFSRSDDIRESNDMVDCILKPKPSFPISRKLDVDDSNRFCLGQNSRMLSSYSLSKMVADEKGLDLHPSIFDRSVLQALIKRVLGDEYLTVIKEQSVGKIGAKCKNFVEYVRMGLKNLQLDSQVRVSDADIEDIFETYVHQGKDRLIKYYLLRSLFASLVEGIILLDRLAFLLEQDGIAEAHIVELFEASVSPRCHAIVSFKT